VLRQSILYELEVNTSLAARERWMQTSQPKSAVPYITSITCKPPEVTARSTGGRVNRAAPPPIIAGPTSREMTARHEFDLCCTATIDATCLLLQRWLFNYFNTARTTHDAEPSDCK